MPKQSRPRFIEHTQQGSASIVTVATQTGPQRIENSWLCTCCVVCPFSAVETRHRDREFASQSAPPSVGTKKKPRTSVKPTANHKDEATIAFVLLREVAILARSGEAKWCGANGV